MATGNLFLDDLQPKDLAALQPHLQRVQLARDDVVTREGEPVVRVVLPVDGIVSVVLEMKDGTAIETRTIGREGGFGLLHTLGSAISYETVIVQISGEGFAIGRRELAAQAARSPSLTEAIVRHAQAALVQAAQSVACNALHDVPQRLCRWLLMTEDRLRRPQLPLKQHHLAAMLGVQRTTVSAAAAELQRQGAIGYSRGLIVVQDRRQLLDTACECYNAVEERARWLRQDADG